MISLIRGDRLELVIPEIKYKDTAVAYELKPTDKVIMEVKKNSNYSKHVIRKIMTTADVVEGKIQIILYPSDTADLEVGRYVFDVRLYMDEKHIYTIIPYSDFEIMANVTDIGE